MKTYRFSQMAGLLLLGGLSYTAASAQVASTKESYYSPAKFSLEAKPLAMALSFMPGVASAGLGAEVSTGGYVSGFANGYIMDTNLPAFARQERDENEIPVMQKVRGYAGDLGLRMYTSADNIDSWYGGAKIGYSYGTSHWSYQYQEVDSTVRTLNPGLEGGYRWIWTNRLLVRLGIGADANIIQENVTTAENQATLVTADAAERIEGYAQVGVIPRADIGVGYRF